MIHRRARRTVYRVGWATVKSAALGACLVVLAGATGSGDLEERVDRARWFEARLEAWQDEVEAGRAADVEAEILALAGRFDREPRLHTVLGLALAALGRPREAVASFETGIRLDPRRPELHYNLARVLVDLGMGGRALSEFEQAIALDPGRVEAYLGMGRGLLALGRWAPAREALDRAHELAPDDPDVLRALAELEDRSGHAEAARRWWSRLDARRPSADSARRLGELLRSTDPHRALEHFDACAERDRSALDCVEAAATLLLEMGRAEEARVRLGPHLDGLSEGALANLLLALQTLGERARLEEVLDRRSPHSATAWGVVALARRDAGDTAGALEAVRDALEIDDRRADLHSLHGVLLAESGEREAARRAWRRALEIDPDHPEARANLEATGGTP